MSSVVYKVTNKLNGMIYIGVHKCDNCKNCRYFASGTRINNAIKKYGIDNFSRKILFSFEDYMDALNAEAYIVNQDFIDRKDTYNIVLGGGNFQLGHKLSDETKRKISNTLSRRKLSDSHRENIRKNTFFKLMSKESHEKTNMKNRGSKRSEETRQKMRDAWVLRKLTNDNNQ